MSGTAIIQKSKKLPREARKTKDSTTDRIWKFYFKPKSNQKLTKEEETIRVRWEKAWHVLCSHRSRKEAAAIIERVCHVSKSVAYDDVANAMMLFGDPRQNSKDAKRAIAETMVLKGLQRAWRTGNLEAYDKFLKKYQDINNLEGDDNEKLADLLGKKRPVIINFISEQSQLHKQATELMKDVAVDTEFEDVED